VLTEGGKEEERDGGADVAKIGNRNSLLGIISQVGGDLNSRTTGVVGPINAKKS
jgi:hypothetical protein